jgi:subtilase family serine protease
MTDAGLSATELAQAYSFSAVYGSGDEGQGSTIGIYELEPYLPSDVATYEGCYSPPITASVSPVPVNGADPNENAGSDESALDIDMAVGMAPQATVKVYVGSDSSDDATNAEAINTYAAMVDQDFVKVISTSWGECERDLGQAQIQAEASLFAEAASQGQSVVAASGDAGSEDCFGDGTSRAQVLQIDDPASQPWVTGVGGTTLGSLEPPPTEQVWDNSHGAGGGGVSSEWTMPSWQSGPGVQNQFTASSPCPLSSGTGTGSCRESPDVSADADPANSPFAEYAGGSWVTVGGTSMGAPLWAALAALANEAAAALPHKGPAATVGLMNPALYQAALLSTPAFNDITSGDNQLLPPYLPTDTNGNPLGGGPYYPATTHYDLASGLGTPIASQLVQDLGSALVAPCSSYAGSQAFVCAVYEDLLGRSPDSDGLSYWAGALASGESLAQVAYAIATSGEYRDHLVSGWYQTFLDRAADSDGLGYWMGALGSGSTDEQAIAGILGSSEFYFDSGGTPDGFVSAVYEDLLGRSPDSGGLSYWAGALASGESLAQVAYAVATSGEYRADLVSGWYQTFLDRAVDSGGLWYWMGALGSGSADEQVIAAILGSAEFYADATS